MAAAEIRYVVRVDGKVTASVEFQASARRTSQVTHIWEIDHILIWQPSPRGRLLPNGWL